VALTKRKDKLMKNIIVALVATIALNISTMSNANGAVSVNWYNSTPILDVGGLASIPQDGDYTVWMFLSDDASIDFNLATLSPGAGESLVANVNFSSSLADYDAGLFYQTLNTGTPGTDGLGAIAPVLLGSYVYTVVTGPNGEYGFANDPNNAVLVEASGTLTQYGADILTYDIGAVTLVPEPSVLAFLGLGGLALAARRRFTA
jgi:hypothetical protein